MTDQKNRRFVLAGRPETAPGPEHFRLEETEIPTPRPGQALLRTLYLTLDPYMRGRMNEAKSYADPVEIGKTMVGATVAEVVATESDAVSVGDVVLAYGGWQTYSVQPAETLRVLDPEELPVTTALGVLGMLAFTGDYIEPYGSPLGQVILAVLLSAYVATLLWMRRMAVAKPLPRFLDLPARNAHRAAQRTAPVENQGALA